MFSISAPNVSMQRMLSVRMPKKRKRELDEDRSLVEGIIKNQRMLLKDEKGFVDKWGMPSNELKGDLKDLLS